MLKCSTNVPFWQYFVGNVKLDQHTPAAGVYLYGSVGSGKSLLMDMFYSVITELNLVPNKRRMHFNAAMLEVPSLTSHSRCVPVCSWCDRQPASNNC